jgi:uncharacterized protein YjlB
LTDAVLNILRELSNNIVVEGANTDGFGNVGDVVWIPDRVGHCDEGSSAQW